MERDCRVCGNFEECYPKGNYVEIQLNGEIRRDLCVNDGKVDWVHQEKD